MKSLTIVFSVLFTLTAFVLVLVLAQMNYNNAVAQAYLTDMSDMDIEAVMQSHGFNIDWHEDVTLLDKVKALFSFHS
jgi:hypothetical protein